MVITSTQLLLSEVEQYALGEWSEPPHVCSSKLAMQWRQSQTDNQRAACLARFVLKQLAELSSTERMETLRELTRYFHQARRDATPHERIMLLKAALQPTVSSSSSSVNWKNTVLGTQLAYQHNLFFTPIQVSFDAEQPISNNTERFKTYSANINPPSYAVAGSSFSTNRQQYLTEAISHVLDAYCSSTTYDKAGQANGIILAIGDGCGGHFGDTHQDHQISRASHFATKHAVRLLSLYQTPSALLNALDEVVQDIAAEVSLKAAGESSTLLCVRAYPIESGYHLVGFNLGDGALLGWNPSLQHCLTLAPAHVSSAGTAGIPGFYKPWEVHVIDIKIKAGYYLIPMTDGMLDGLPTARVESVYPNQLSYRTISFEEQKVKDIFSPVDRNDALAAEHYLKLLIQHALNKLDNERIEKQTSNDVIQLGDDIMVGIVPLPHTSNHPSWTNAVGKWWSKAWGKVVNTQEPTKSSVSKK